MLPETWLRWVGVDLDEVQDQRAYLVRITTRQALSRLRALGRRKGSYVAADLSGPTLIRVGRQACPILVHSSKHKLLADSSSAPF